MGLAALSGRLWRSGGTLELHHAYVVTAKKFQHAVDAFARALLKQLIEASRDEEMAWVDGMFVHQKPRGGKQHARAKHWTVRLAC